MPIPARFHFDRGARLEPSLKLQTAAVVHRSRGKDIARIDRLAPRCVLDDLPPGELHSPGVAARPFLAIDAKNHLDVGGIDFVKRNDAWPENIALVEILAFTRAGATVASSACTSRALKSLKIVKPAIYL